MKKLLLTGASGYVGTAFLEAYGSKYRVRVLGRTPVKGVDDFCKGDITDPDAFNRAAKGMDVIMHLAAATTDGTGISDRDYFEKNTVAVFNLLEAAVKNKVKKVVYGSSVCAVGFRATEELMMEDAKCAPSDGMYGYSKYLSERLCECYAQTHKIDIISLRTAMVVPQHEFAVPANPFAKHWLGVVHIEDVIEAFRLAVDNDNIRYGVFHISSGSRHSKFDITQARKILGYQPKHNFNDVIQSKGGVGNKTRAIAAALAGRLIGSKGK